MSFGQGFLGFLGKKLLLDPVKKLSSHIQPLTANLKGHCILLTTEPGLETVVENEWIDYCQRHGLESGLLTLKPMKIKGMLALNINRSLREYIGHLLRLGSIYHIQELLFQTFPRKELSLEYLGEIAREVYIPAFKQAKSFRVSCRRMGEHDFGSMDVMRVVGAILKERYDTQVDLTSFDLEIRFDIYDNFVWVGLRHTRQSLDKRYSLAYYRNVSIKPVLANAMCQMSRISPDEESCILDPFCGAGTILWEAAKLFPKATLLASDLYQEVITGAEKNADLLELNERVSIRQADARRLSEYYELLSVDTIICNPPFGLKMGAKLNLRSFYKAFLLEAARVLKDEGKIVLIVLKRGLFRAVVREIGLYDIKWIYDLDRARKNMRIYILQKRAIDLIIE